MDDGKRCICKAVKRVERRGCGPTDSDAVAGLLQHDHVTQSSKEIIPSELAIVRGHVNGSKWVWVESRVGVHVDVVEDERDGGQRQARWNDRVESKRAVVDCVLNGGEDDGKRLLDLSFVICFASTAHLFGVRVEVSVQGHSEPRNDWERVEAKSSKTGVFVDSDVNYGRSGSGWKWERRSGVDRQVSAGVQSDNSASVDAAADIISSSSSSISSSPSLSSPMMIKNSSSSS